jgi:hypothetical protein
MGRDVAVSARAEWTQTFTGCEVKDMGRDVAVSERAE